MGRRPNSVILTFFERGPKLNDNSNRYPHRCKSCGEDFPKGRIDSLINHLTRRCPAISEADRINACLTLNGLNSASQRAQRLQAANQPANHAAAMAAANAAGHSLMQDSWTALETLAEVSRQIDLSEKHDDPVPGTNPQDPVVVEGTQATIPHSLGAPLGTNPFELQEQFTLENPPLSYDDRRRGDKKAPSTHDLTTDEKLQHLLQSAGSPAPSNLSVAAAATARLNPSLLDPQLIVQEQGAESLDLHEPSTEMMIEYPPSEKASSPPPVTESQWGEMTYLTDAIQPPPPVIDQGHQLPLPMNKGGFRMDTGMGSRQRHTRARFDQDRRKEVQEVRRIGACIRCRILRKTCSKGTPCDTCRKVLAPRVWRTGCQRTKLADQLDLYSAGVQIVLSQKRVNEFKTSHKLTNNGSTIEASHFPEIETKIIFEVLEDQDSPSNLVIMIDVDKEDIPLKVESYMRQMLPELIHREPSAHIRTILETSRKVAEDSNDELLRKALELWGLVELMDRERQWAFTQKPAEAGKESSPISDETHNETFTTICMQLTAGAERRAASTSKSLLNGIQRHLQDGKMKLGFPMFLTTIVFLNCVEKTTWAFKAWESENLRSLWPLEKPPSSYVNQGYGLCDLLRMLLHIRHIIPKLSIGEPNSPIVCDEDDTALKQFYQDLNISAEYLRLRHEQPAFEPTDSRSLEFLFCAPLLFPQTTPSAS